MTQKQKIKVVKSLKDARIQGGGRTFQDLATVADINHAFRQQLSSYLQGLKHDGKVMYFSTTKVWYWTKQIYIDCMT